MTYTNLEIDHDGQDIYHDYYDYDETDLENDDIDYQNDLADEDDLTNLGGAQNAYIRIGKFMTWISIGFCIGSGIALCVNRYGGK
jgi:hypothetical protein